MPGFDNDSRLSSQEIEALRPLLDREERELFDRLQADAPGFLEGMSVQDLERVMDGEFSLADAVSAHPDLDGLSPATVDRLIDEGELTTFIRLRSEMHPEKLANLPDLDPEVRQAVDELLGAYEAASADQLQRDHEVEQRVWEREIER